MALSQMDKNGKDLFFFWLNSESENVGPYADMVDMVLI